MNKLFLQALFLLNLTNLNIFSMDAAQDQEEDKKNEKRIVIEKNGIKNILFLDDDNNLKLWHVSNLIGEVKELIESPNKKYAIAITIDEKDIKYPKALFYLISFAKCKMHSRFHPGILDVEEFSTNLIYTIGWYDLGSCKISENGRIIKVKTFGYFRTTFSVDIIE